MGEAPGSTRVLDFTLHKLGDNSGGRTLLVIGGIQGDEPGGFNAASLLVTHFQITHGQVWVVPNLNFISIVNRSRGIHGDLNRKFAAIPGNDPEFKAIKKIKSIILDNQVDMILNLHDGSGFYRYKYLDKLRNPNRWGQCIIIDQDRVSYDRFGNLKDIADQVILHINGHLFDPTHDFRVKNTRTREGNEEMAKTLTYFAARHGKPAFGVEASKSFPTHKRAYYHILAMESFMNLLGISFERKFVLSATGIKNAIDKNVKVAFYDRKIFLDVYNARHRLNYVPLKKGSDIEFIPSNPLIAILHAGKKYRIFHGNRRITNIYPQYFEYDSSIDAITLWVDGRETEAKFGEIINVDKSFKVIPLDGYRVNIIGFSKPGHKNESGIPIQKTDIQRKFSIDKSGRYYRIEVYRKEKFTGMVIVNFDRQDESLHASNASRKPMTNLEKLIEETVSVERKNRVPQNTGR